MLLITVFKFTDDTKVFGVVEDVVQNYLLQDDLSKLVHWSKKWQMQFTTTKCKILYVGKTN